MIFVLNNSRINLHRVNKRGKHHFRKQQMIFPEKQHQATERREPQMIHKEIIKEEQHIYFFSLSWNKSYFAPHPFWFFVVVF